MKRSRQLWLDEGDLAGCRWDPAFWDPALRDPLKDCVHPVASLGDFVPVDGISYGRILPGRKPPEGDGPMYVTQRAIRPTGFDPGACVTIEEGCAWDTPRHRIRRGDLLLPRSGVGTLARGVMTVFQLDADAVVDCFTDRVTLHGYAPEVAALFLRTPPGWLQIHRLINGVGPPNISFSEIRGLQIPVFPSEVAVAIRVRYHDVHRAHLAWLARRDAVLAAGLEPADDVHCGELRRTASRELAAALADVASYAIGQQP